jgi:hypothetical protein
MSFWPGTVGTETKAAAFVPTSHFPMVTIRTVRRMTSTRIALLSLVSIAGGAVACAHPHREIISSEGSAYSPVARARVSWRVVNDTVRVAVDHGQLIAPGPGVRPGPVIARNVYAYAFIGSSNVPRQGGPPEQSAVRRWAMLARSDSLPIAPYLELSAPIALEQLRFAIPATRPPGDSMWVGLSFVGEAAAGILPLEAAIARPGDIWRGIRMQVFVCSTHYLSGSADSSRADRMRSVYIQEC